MPKRRRVVFHSLHVSESVSIGSNGSTFTYYHPNREEQLYVVIPPLLSAAIHVATREQFDGAEMGSGSQPPSTTSAVKWTLPSETTSADFLCAIQLPQGSGHVTQITFHRKGDYFATICTHGPGNSLAFKCN